MRQLRHLRHLEGLELKEPKYLIAYWLIEKFKWIGLWQAH